MIYKLYKNSKRVSSPSLDSATINLNNSDWVIQTLLLRKNLEIENVSKLGDDVFINVFYVENFGGSFVKVHF